MGGWGVPPLLQGWFSPECSKEHCRPVVLPLACPTTCRTPQNTTSAPGCGCSHNRHGQLPGSLVVSPSQQQTLLCSSTPPRCPSFSHPRTPSSASSRDIQLCFRLYLWCIHLRQRSTHTQRSHTLWVKGVHHWGQQGSQTQAPPPFLKRGMWFTKENGPGDTVQAPFGLSLTKIKVSCDRMV